MPNSVILGALAASLLGLAADHPLDRRVVDIAGPGDAHSEEAHGYAGHDVVAGVANGRAFRKARGWMHYALTTFDDTEVTVALTFLATDSVPRSYDLIVEDSLIVTRRFTAGSSALNVVEHTVPFVLTKGKSSIAVVIRGRDGLSPAVHEIRTVQDHYEVNFPGIAR